MQKRWTVSESQQRDWDVESAMCDATMRGPLDAMSRAGILDIEERTRHIVDHCPIPRLNHVMWLRSERVGHPRGVA